MNTDLGIRIMSTFRSISVAGPPIDQRLISELSKGSLRQHLHSQDAFVPDDIEAFWHCLVSSTLSHDSTERYLTAACNCISVFLLAAASSPLSGVKQFSTSRNVWFDGYECVQKAFDGGKTKPALQVLETLAQLLREHPDKRAASDILHESSQKLLYVLLTGAPGGQIKSVCIILTCLLKKTGLLMALEDEVAQSLNQVSSSWKRYQHQNGITLGDLPYRESNSRDLFLALLFAVRNLETRSAALKLFSLLLHSEDWLRACGPAQSAAEVIELLLRNDTTSLGDFADNVIPVILDDEARYETFRDLYKPDKDYSESRLILYLSVLKAGRLKKFLSEDALPREVVEALGHPSNRSQGPESHYISFDLLLRAGSPSVRIHAYNLLTTNFGTIMPIPVGVLQCLLSSLRYLHDDNAAHERGEVISVTRRLFRRLESSRAHLQKKRPQSSQDENTLGHYDDFLRQIVIFLFLELDPGVSYQRHVLALQTLRLLINVAPEVCIDHHSLASSLSNLALDSFDDVRSLAALLLGNVLRLDPESTTYELVRRLVRDAEKLSAMTCRHDHADAAGRLWAVIISQNKKPGDAHNTLFDLWQKLDDHTKAAESLTPKSGFPLHAKLLGLAYSLGAGIEDKNALCTKLLEICLRIWTVVQLQLCVDSPETATDDAEEENLGGPKDLLAYSWRALRDSSLLLQSILRACREDINILAQVGWLCMEQLTLLRHRGAFSTVAQTFNLCCEQARTSHDPSTRELNNAWYKAALQEIEKQSKKLTRRSAGLPAMFCAVLSPTDAETFGYAYLDLKSIACKPITVNEGHDDDVPLPQVHALNCLKDIMTHSNFRASSERFLSETLELAANGLSSPIWAIRNCGLMLLRACMTRLPTHGLDTPKGVVGLSNDEGTNKSPLTVTMSLLEPKGDQPGNSSPRSKIIFAGLDLAKHVGLAHPDDKRLTELIYLQLGSSVWAIRDHAARVLAARFVVHKSLGEFPEDVSPPPDCPENLLHGTILLVRYVREGFRQNADPTTTSDHCQMSLRLVSTVAERIGTDCSPYTKAACLDVVNDLFLHNLRAGSTRDYIEASPSSLDASTWRIEGSDSFCRPRLLLNAVLCMLLRSRHHPDQDENVKDLLSALIEHPDAARSVLEQVEGLSSTSDLVNLLMKLMAATQAADVRALAMKRLTECMESDGDEVSEVDVASLYPTVDEFGSCDRTGWGASLRLEACLICIHLSQHNQPITSQVESRLRSWLYKITVASNDQLECSTRSNSAAALRHCGPPMVRRLREETLTTAMTEKQELMLDLIMIVYDQLNDDDEEIRQTAEQTAAHVLKQLQPKLRLPIPMCALGARETLLMLTVDRFGSGPELQTLALTRIMSESSGDTPERRPSIRTVFRESASERLANIRASMNDLFTEEKQNLYIDELEEVVAWSNVLRQCNLSQLDSIWQAAALKWCSEGFDALNTLLGSKTDNNGEANEVQGSLHPLGPTYHPEVLLLSLRVVALAIVLKHAYIQRAENSLAEVDQEDIASKLRQKTRELRDTVTKVGAHWRVLEALGITPGSEKE